MALLVKKTKFKNTEVEVSNLYVRLQYFAFADGKKVSVKLITALNKDDALSYKELATNLPESLALTLSDEQEQNLATIHELVKAKLEESGFEVTIDLK